MDPQLRKLCEVAYEAWIDSGINHLALRGSDRVRPLCDVHMGYRGQLPRVIVAGSLPLAVVML